MTLTVRIHHTRQAGAVVSLLEANGAVVRRLAVEPGDRGHADVESYVAEEFAVMQIEETTT